MTTTSQIIKVYRGDTAAVSVSITRADGTPFEPSLDAAIKWRMARTSFSPEEEVLVRKELGQGMELQSYGVEFVLDATDTDFPPGVYYHEMKVLDATDVATVMTGSVVIKPAMRMVTDYSPLAPNSPQTKIALTASVRRVAAS
ncbi:hypothetical protein [Bradyrhizobium sp. Gha]|uniref:hypothetical protein n=1 Tax=Bradyrhizobium sp. Gha TaxID=1855318 RepID=UPI0008E2FDB8|nr:hypothetical protein [Bradyrhizobium sp. Gha]SFJ25504.1 hypothetical protein SAMN05216525_12141 [Bradyrhizobium sp. Gha]